MNTATNSEDRLESILGQIRVLQAKSDERAEVTGENFNVFSILDRESDEVKTHSAIIAELLNPHGSHSQGTLFLKLFLKKLLKKLQEDQKAQEELKQLREKLEQIQEEEFDKFRVEVETSKKNKKGEALGRIDILIESGDVCIVIENKIYADDQKRQLGRYYEYASGTGKKLGIIYLTLEGDGPKDFTLYGDEKSKFDEKELDKIKDTVVCLSYEKFIDKWLDACIKEVARIPQIRETLHQYQMTVRKLTGKLPPEVEDTLNKAAELEDEIIRHLQCEFWREFKKRLAGQIPKFHSNFQIYESNMERDEEIPDEQLEDSICHNSLGLTFSIPDSLPCDNKHEVAFRVFYERSKTHSYFRGLYT